MDDLFNLFANVEKPSADSLFVVHNDCVEKMSVAEIFDAQRYTDFKAVSYVSSPKFFAEVIKDFQTVTFILGIDNSENLSKFSDGISNYLDSAESLNFFNDLPDKIKDSLIEERLQIRYGKQGVMIHDKIYLMANEKTSEYRVIIGSANFSNSAFNRDNLNFENVRVDDSKKLYDLYLARFKYLLEQTVDYIPERARRKYKDNQTLLVVTPETNVDLLLDKLEQKNINLFVTAKQRDDLIERYEKLIEEQETVKTNLKLVEVLTESKLKDGRLPIKKIPQLVKKKTELQKIFYKVPKSVKKDNLDFRELLVMKGDCRIYKKTDANSDEVTLYSARAATEKIKATLEKINAFTKAYYDFAMTPNKIISSKIYELILYAFTAPFI